MPEKQQPQTNPNQASTPEDLEATRARPAQAEVARNEAKQASAEGDKAAASAAARLAELQAEGEALRAERSNLQAALSEAKKASEASAAELARVTQARDQAVIKYLNMAKALNPTVPEGIIEGGSIQEIDASVEKGKAIVEAVKKAMEAEASQARVPAGAPTRGAIPSTGLSPREKIAYAIEQGKQR